MLNNERITVLYYLINIFDQLKLITASIPVRTIRAVLFVGPRLELNHVRPAIIWVGREKHVEQPKLRSNKGFRLLVLKSQFLERNKPRKVKERARKEPENRRAAFCLLLAAAAWLNAEFEQSRLY